MSAELVAFLWARLDDDEQMAHVLANHRFKVGVTIPGGSDLKRVDVARYRPPWTFTDVASKRAMLKHIQTELSRSDNPWWYADRLTPLLRLLALPYAQHIDYQPEWAPDVGSSR